MAAVTWRTSLPHLVVQIFFSVRSVRATPGVSRWLGSCGRICAAAGPASPSVTMNTSMMAAAIKRDVKWQLKHHMRIPHGCRSAGRHRSRTAWQPARRGASCGLSSERLGLFGDALFVPLAHGLDIADEGEMFRAAGRHAPLFAK